MKRNLYLCTSILFTLIVSNLYSQNGSVGINTDNPDKSAILDITSNPKGNDTYKGVLLTKMTTVQRNTILNPASGLLIYNTSIPCLQVNDGTPTSPRWNCISGNTSSGQLLILNCTNAIHNGGLSEGLEASGVTTFIPYSGANGGEFDKLVINSTGVTGLTATLEAGNFTTGSGNLVFTITGTPSSVGTANFNLSIGGQTCSFSRNVSPLTIPSTITLAKNRMYMLASVYDQDYLPYIDATGVATTNSQSADGVNEAITIDLQGTLTTTGVSVKIPVTATGDGILPGYSQIVNIPAYFIQDGVSRNIKFSWASQSYTSSTKFIDITIKAETVDVNFKKLDINSGIGNDVLGVLVGTFTYPYDNSGNTTSYEVRVIAGIPDKMFGVNDNNGNNNTHMFLYLPTVAEDGNIWLNNNLGASYSDINHANFNITKQATSVTDHLAYGSKFQWGRKGDGHELITYNNGTTATAQNGTTTLKANNPSDALFIIGSGYPSDWRLSPDSTLWGKESSTNNPCPRGFRVPTTIDFNTWFTSVGGFVTINSAFSSKLKLTKTGLRTYNGDIYSVGIEGVYWTASVENNNAATRIHLSNGGRDVIPGSDRGNALTVRCIKN